MAEIDECIKARSYINSLKVLNNSDIAFSTKLHGVKIANHQRCEVDYNYANAYLNSNTTAVCFSNDGKLLAFANDKIISIVNLQSKELIKTIDTYTESIQILCFDDSSNHLIAGSNNGRVLHYTTHGLSSLISRLCSFPYNRDEHTYIRQNYVSAIEFRKNTLAVTGYGGTIHIIDIHSRANTTVLENSKARTNALCFIDDNTIISGNFDGVIKLFNIKEKKPLKQLSSNLSKIKQIVMLQNTNFALICSNSNIISILDIKNFKLINSEYLEFEDVVNRIGVIDKNTIIAALKNSKIQKVTLSDEEELESLILHNSLEKAFILTENEPLLKETKQYEKLLLLYNKLYNNAALALSNQNITIAKEILKPFINIKSKQKEINNLFIAFKNYDRLKIFFVDKKYSLAYAIVEKYPELKNTPIFKKMEKDFKDAFKNAQKYMILEQAHNAKSILQPYITIPSKKNLIEFVLKQNKEFLEFIVAVDKNNYAKACLLAQRNKLFVQIPSYSVLMNNIDEHISIIKDSIKKGDISSANSSIDVLKDVIHLKSPLRIFKNELKHLKELQEHYEKNDFKACYETIDKYPHLSSTELGHLLSEHWQKIISKCEAYALRGNFVEIKKTLGELITVDGRLHKIGDLFRVAFHVRIKAYLSKKAYSYTEKTIYSYIDTFGSDSEINTLMKKYEKASKNKLAITQDINKRVTRNSWVESRLINDID